MLYLTKAGLTLLTVVFGITLGNNIDDVLSTLSTERRIRIFGTNGTIELPQIDVVQIELILPKIQKPFRKRFPTTLEYRATIDNEVTVLALRHNKDLISPGCLVHHYKRDGNKTLAPCFHRNRNCYYTGRSLNHTDSWVAASVCGGGLRGAMVLGNTSLIISPLDDTDHLDLTNGINITNGIRHVVYRYQGGKQKCSTKHPSGRVLYPNPSRRKRETVGHYMEIGVVIDPTMVFFHGEDIDAYTASTLNIASQLYANQRTGHDLELVITSIHKMESYQGFDIQRTSDANHLLTEFCEWKSKQWNNTFQADAVILLTRVDIAYNGSSLVTGLALPSGMCNQKRNCALIEDTSPVMGYTIAHEIGHLLTMQHDGPDGDTTCGSSIMNVDGASGSAASSWSDCSKASLDNFFRSNASSCLLNKPLGYDGDHVHAGDIPLPGILYPADQQCQLRLGTESSACLVGSRMDRTQRERKNACEQIVCRDTDKTCYRYPVPMLDGSDINNTRVWCIDGEPMAITSADGRPPIHGGWSEWSSEWSTCTRTCGGGVKIRRRKCNNPRPQFAGEQCQGSEINAVMCNFQRCIKTSQERPCSELSISQNYTFVPVDSGGCKCSGSAPKMNQIVLNSADGMECMPDSSVPFTRCIDGTCREFGCDGHLESGLMFDTCGRCNGSGLGCSTVKGTYKRDGPPQVYETVVVFPQGVAGITVNQSNGYCFLDVRIGEDLVFNASGFTQNGVYTRDGVRIRYTTNPEQIQIMEPLPVEVQVQVYRKYDYIKYANVTPNVEYQYSVLTSTGPTSFRWSVVNTPCSQTCGTGLSVPEVKCRSLTGPVEDYFCDIYKKPSETPRPCNTHSCPPKWDTTQWSQCSVSCGNGTRNRTVNCVQENAGLAEVVPESQCSSSTRPVAMDTCDMGKCPSVWIPGGWSRCSKTCGIGTKYRRVQCFDSKNSSNQIPANECDVKEKPVTQDLCEREPCRIDIVGVDCSDSHDNCAGYRPDICVGQYKGWAEKNCMKLCRICDACKDDEVCEQYLKINVHFCNEVPDWTKIHCRRACNYCNECSDVKPYCNEYGRKYCTDPMYRSFMQVNCQRFCGFC